MYVCMYTYVFIHTTKNTHIYIHNIFICVYLYIYVVHSTYIYFCIHILIFARFLLSRKSLEIFESLLATPVCKGNHIPYVTHTFSVKVFK